MKKKLKRYVATMDSANDGVFKVDLVDRPAIEQKSVYFAHQAPVKFMVDDERKIIVGPALIPGEPIYRCEKNEATGEIDEYEIIFPVELMEKIIVKYMLQAKKDAVGEMHVSNEPVGGVSIMSCWMADKQLGVKHLEGYESNPDRTIYMAGKVENDAIRAKIKAGALTGWSIEGLFSFIEEQKLSSNEPDFIAELSKALLG